ncbi:MAG: RagB/SusD family nutrient uptake outer membrane protein [Sphingobacterium sp.]|uniref:RagB/SusD family nutrient uptake outer membrane protein n=1 Tax=Sphingobacterium sp. TaxID=341027 RepID=UPI002849F035|nr:RagB/SusD family nutrient uptake outer membrane protein [Sphingobacterium sp.]MDR3009535.1 RagB/SusD family nutrient uptake outer membrane protein [Sphingobacterium sp.]
MKNTYRNKTYIVLLMVGLGMLTQSCNKWLDVQPSTQTTEEKQFSSEQGYKDALIGIYQKMAQTNSYGKDLTYGCLDVLAQLYQNKANANTDTYGQLARYNYTDGSVKVILSSLWSTQYSTIAQANYILKDIDTDKGLFSGINFQLVKGEALATRALLHFDLLRLFAAAPLANSAAETSGIPYMTAFTVSPGKELSRTEVLSLVEKDLKEAETLLAAYPVIDQIKDNTTSTSLEVFTMFRQNRLNVWAVKALLARLYLYKGDKANALKYAKEVIESQKFEFVNGNTNTVNAASATSNAIFSTEHIFSIYKSNLKDVSDRYFKTEAGAAENEDLFTTLANLNSWYEVSVSGHAIDIRGPQASNSRWNQFNASTVYSNKYYVGNNVNNVNQKLIPVIKLSEVYYIAAEASETIDQALVYLNKVRTARLIPALSASTINTDALLEGELFKEYRKDFYAEGQLWYYYKRKNYSTLQNTVGGTMNSTKYDFPLPDNEIEFGLN